MLKRTRPPRVLFYADMEAIVAHCVAAAEMLRRELGAHIIMMVPDRKTYFDEAFENYELYDHDNLFQRSSRSWFRTSRSGSAMGAVAAAPAGVTSVAESADPNGETIAPSRTELFGLRKILARSRTLKGIYYLIRKTPYWALYGYQRIPVLQLAGQTVESCRRALYVKRFLRAVRSDLIVLAEDNVERLSTTLVNESRRQGIPSIIIPFTIPNPLEPAKAYRDRKRNQVRGPLGWLVSAVFPKWRFRLDGQSLLRMPALQVLVLEALGQSSPAPWILNRGNASKICLDSEALRDAYLELGFPVTQLRVVGDVNGETLHRGLANKSRLLADVLARHDLPPGRPLILCGFPPDQYGSKANDFEFQNYDALLEGWMGSFEALGERANVLVRPHPRIPLSRFETFKAPNVRFTLQPTAELIPLCDLYIASISATIRWAIACGIPVINYDTYRYCYGDYGKATGVLFTDSLADFRTELARFVTDPLFATGLVERQRGVMRYWGVIDDQLPMRFAALISELTSAEPLLKVPFLRRGRKKARVVSVG